MTLTDHLPGARRRPTRTPSSTPSPAGRRSGASPLYPHQEEALIEIVSGANVILSTPTGSGKSLVAAGAHFAALADERTHLLHRARSRRWCRRSSSPCARCSAPANVGMLTGDASVNADAPIICCTAEILANIALREGADADVGQVVMDEFHFYAEPDRGWAWQVPLIELPQAQFLLMSATLGDVTRFDDDLTRRTGRPTAVVALGRAAGPADLRVRDDAAARDARGAAQPPTRRRSTSCTSPRPRRWSGRRR